MIVYAGNKLQANPAAIAGDPTPSTAWQWTRNGVAITGATASTYVASAQDLGSNLSVIQQAINLVGTAVATASAVGPVTLFSPAVMFSTGINGVWYDPSDLSTLYRDAAGTLPVTAVEQPVGLMLDKSKQLVLGSELVTNGDFSQGTTGWIAGNSSQSVSNGEITITANGASYPDTHQSILCTVGKTYLLTAIARKGAGSTSVGVQINGVGGSYTVSTVNTQLRYQFTATLTAYSIAAVINGATVSGDTATFDNISVRELPGNHAFNPSGNSANFPVLSARYNLLTKTEDFSDAAWIISGSASVSGNVTTAPNGTVTADRITFTASAADGVSQNGTSSASQHTMSVWARTESGTKKFSFFLYNATNGVVRSPDFTATTNWQQFTFTTTVSVSTSSWYIANASTADAGSVVIWGADLRVTNDALNQPAYQRVNTATDYDTVGFKPYLRFNGTNQWLQTNSIDFSYGDKMFVSAGVRKLSDAASAIVAELSADVNGYNGSLYLGSAVGGDSWRLASRGTSITTTGSAGFNAPITNVVSEINNISAPSATLRINGSQVSQSTATQGTGNYGNYPLYIGARAGSSLWFDGRLYGLTVAGKQASASEISGNEYFLNSKTNAY